MTLVKRLLDTGSGVKRLAPGLLKRTSKPSLAAGYPLPPSPPGARLPS